MRLNCRKEREYCLIRPGSRLEKKRYLNGKYCLIKPSYRAEGKRCLIKPSCRLKEKHCLVRKHFLIKPNGAEKRRCLIRPSYRLKKKCFLIEKSEKKQYLIRLECKTNIKHFLMKPGCILEEKSLPVWNSLLDEAWQDRREALLV